jgi:thiol-disulfide isomerase/thioredoxin
VKVLKFGAVWCSGCLIMKPRWEEIAKELPWLKTEYYDVDKNPKMEEKYRLTDYPAAIFLDKKGQEFHRIYGEKSKKDLKEFVVENKDK